MEYRGTEDHIVYDTNRVFLVAAAAASLADLLAMLPLYAGWWRLGRAVSLYLLEMAQAFGAPLLVHVNSNADNALLVREAGATGVYYSMVEERAPNGESVRLQLR